MKTFFKHEMYSRKPKPAKENGSRRNLEDMSVGELIQKLDQEVSFYVRGNAVVWHLSPFIPCFTCGARHHWKNMDNGHYIGREWIGTRWDLRNLRPQCTSCNCYQEGNKHLFAYNLEKEGIDLKALKLLADFAGKTKPARETLIAEIGEYRGKNKILRETLKKMEQ